MKPWRRRRRAAKVLGAAFRRDHWRAAANMPRVLERPLDGLRRYLLGDRGGCYPVRIGLRTPQGRIALQVDAPVDFLTVNEVFCRLDYPAPPPGGVVVDVGANLGISAAWFLTRRRDSRVVAFEPDPRNLPRLEANLAPFAGRWRLEPVALALQDGEAGFAIEASGRYGRLSEQPFASVESEVIRVRCSALDAALREVLAREGRIDVLKLDVEGWEAVLLAALPPDLLPRIGVVAAEGRFPDIALPGFRASERGGVTVFRRTG